MSYVGRCRASLALLALSGVVGVVVVGVVVVGVVELDVLRLTLAVVKNFLFKKGLTGFLFRVIMYTYKRLREGKAFKPKKRKRI